MKNRKKILVIILATILAFFAVFYILKFEQRKNIQTTPKQNLEKQDNIVPPTGNKIEQKQILEQKLKKSTKIQENKTNVKQAIKPTVKKGTVKVPNLKPTEEITPAKIEDSKVEENAGTDKIENEIVVPVKYVTRNTYKYIYTPTNFIKK